jgi:hypothetical protein
MEIPSGRNIPKVIISLDIKNATAAEIAAGSPEFDGSASSCRQLQQTVAATIDHRCLQESFAAE